MAPEWFVEGLPDSPLDGELWIERKQFQRTASVVRRQDKSDHWRDVRFLVFDAPTFEGGFEDRIGYLEETLGSNQPFAEFHAHKRCDGVKHMQEELARIEKLGGEGLMLREPGSIYEVGRSMTLLKVKTFHDAEAEVLDHQAGKGKHKGRMGALQVRLADGTEFSLGTGFSDKQRESPPPIGSLVTFRYQELTNGGVPRFPSFVRTRKKGAGAVESKAAANKASAKATTVKTKTSTKTKPAKTKADAGSGNVRYFELVDDKSAKFWEINHDGLSVTVRYGRIGSDGQTKVKEFADEDKATAHAKKLVDQKTGKGYEEQ